MVGSAYHNRRQSQPTAPAMTTSFVLAAVSHTPQLQSPVKQPLNVDPNISMFNYQVNFNVSNLSFRESITKIS